MKSRWKILILLFALAVVGGVALYRSVTSGPPPMPEALAAMASTPSVTVNTHKWLAFEPAAEQASVGLIFYPGGMVPPEAYAPYAQEFSRHGYLTVIVPMPSNMAYLGIDRAKEVVAGYPEVETWVLAGHSLGGVAAARFVKENPGEVDGLALWASIPARSDTLGEITIPAISIYGTYDGYVLARRVEATRDRMPPQTEWIRIEGGTHAQFGWFGPMGKDIEGAISRGEQQEIVVNAMLDFLFSLER